MATTKALQPFVVCHRVSARRVTIAVIAGIVVTVLASIVAWDGGVAPWEISLLEAVNGWPDSIEPVMWVLQQAGILWAPVIVGLIIVSFTRTWQHFVPFVMVLPLKLGIEKGIVKQFVERERPFTSVGDSVDVRGTAFEGLSFPSGHTTTAFAVAVLATAFLPRRWRWLPLTWAAIVAVARLYYGEHNVLDVVAGAALGSSFSMVLWFVFLNRFVHSSCDCDVS